MKKFYVILTACFLFQQKINAQIYSVKNIVPNGLTEITDSTCLLQGSIEADSATQWNSFVNFWKYASDTLLISGPSGIGLGEVIYEVGSLIPSTPYFYKWGAVAENSTDSVWTDYPVYFATHAGSSVGIEELKHIIILDSAVKVFDLLGNTINVKKLGNLPPGIYLYILETSTAKKAGKFFVW